MKVWRRPGLWVFAVLFGSYAYFWQARDWNSASRLMLTYALVDRWTVAIDGLEDQTGDRASFGGHFYTDKLPGYSLLAAVPYLLSKAVLRLPSHPLNVPGFAHWPADYWVTLGTSGLFTALSGVLLVGLARELGCGPRRAALVGLAYGLATPAYAYATMAHGHQTSSSALLAAFILLRRTGAKHQGIRIFIAGLLASYASVIELSIGPVAAVLGLYLIAQVLGKRRKPSNLGDFGVGALLPLLVLLGYNQLAYGSPWELGYFHHSAKIFADVHSEANPLGLHVPDAHRIMPLLFGRYRGLTYYAPIVVLVPFGLFTLARRGEWAAAIVSTASMAAVFAVNLSYPEWTGGWSTGPRLLVPLLPFAMIPVAGCLANGRTWIVCCAAALALAGGVLMLLFVGVGGHLAQFYSDPLSDAVWPIWRGRPVEGWVGEPFARNLGRILFPNATARLPASAKGLQFAPLALAQAGAIGLLVKVLRRPASDKTGAAEEVKPGC